MSPPLIRIGTGGYSDTALLGTLYPHGTPPSDFLRLYACHYDAVEINSTFHAPIGGRALQGMAEKAAGKLRFSVKLHQDFSHKRRAGAVQARHFLNALRPLGDALANVCVQFPESFERNPANRRYLAELVSWFAEIPLAMEFRHHSWHIPQVFEFFAAQPQLLWCNVDYPPRIGLPESVFRPLHRTAYMRLHGRNPHWRAAHSAAERHDYRYQDHELKQLADTLHRHRDDFDELYLYFQNTTRSHSFYNIPVLKAYLASAGFAVKTATDGYAGAQAQLFD
ncbi:DUF72 domain-containing protein [Conchiformibius kuhniae]|uniref:DUF72 domain-containing protein n=1 Tax=Conchiformibius kuhniae TaxID=211502 RepID=A0A8T9MV62_9NEIS|nr:DUF72 domain-containing protein [Conchiformibius kuhniae]UOP04248.1 DUF72 domain-containing protein [Conchiformibius kuhniae]